MGPRMLAYNDTGSLEHLRPRKDDDKPDAAAETPTNPSDKVE
jgi:hypothetical protein